MEKPLEPEAHSILVSRVLLSTAKDLKVSLPVISHYGDLDRLKRRGLSVELVEVDRSQLPSKGLRLPGKTLRWDLPDFFGLGYDLECIIAPVCDEPATSSTLEYQSSSNRDGLMEVCL